MLGLVLLGLYSCKKTSNKYNYFLSPVEGTKVAYGSILTLKTDAETGEFDSIKYFIDARLLMKRADTQSVKVHAVDMPLGSRLLTAIIYNGSDSIELNTNIQLLPSRPPVQYGYKVINVYPHDTGSYTQGLEYHDGVLYESGGIHGESSLRKVELKTGRILKLLNIDARFFAEGITVIGNRIIMLTWREGVGFVFDKNTFNKLAEFPYTSGAEGWGLAFNGSHILNSDGTNNIYLLNKDSFLKESTIEVYDTNGAVDSLNELEFIDGKIYANIYQTDKIAIIDPKTGAVEAYIDLAGILPATDYVEGVTDVLNGIAWDAKGKRLFVTGKKWNKLFEIKVK